MGLLDSILSARRTIKKGHTRKDTSKKGCPVSLEASYEHGVDRRRHGILDEPEVRRVRSASDNTARTGCSAMPARDTDAFETTADQASVHLRMPKTSGHQAASFYGGWKARNVERAVLRLLCHVRKKLQQGVLNPPFQHFPLQSLAFQFADSHELSDELSVFSVEKSTSGKRSFIVTSYEEFWRRYEDMMPKHRHHYEIIREGTPCKLYFDLEFKPLLNPGLDGTALVDLVINLATQKLKEDFGHEARSDSWIELDSSTDAKFSRHLIFHDAECCFKSNLHVGCFVEGLSKMAHDRGPAGEQNKLMVHSDPEGKRASFIDEGVYTKNRAFRLMLSSKACKAAILKPTGRKRPFETSRSCFMESLICNVPAESRLLTTFEGDHQPMRSKCRRISKDERMHCGNQGEPSPFPEIDAVIGNAVCDQDGVTGWIRNWAWSEEERVLLLNIGGSRYCNNIGRHHKSNGIYFIADLQDGVWYQRCYDPDCRGYRSEAMPLPAACIPQSFSSHADTIAQTEQFYIIEEATGAANGVLADV